MGYYLDPALTKRRCDSYRSHLEKDNQLQRAIEILKTKE